MSFVCNEFHRFWTGLTDREASAVLTAALDPLTGEVLSPAAVRKLACDASIIPIVLGSQSQPLHVGRTRRLATPRTTRRPMGPRQAMQPCRAMSVVSTSSAGARR
jgi:hypothetical protein